MPAAGRYFGKLRQEQPITDGVLPNASATPYIQLNWIVTHIAEAGQWVELPETIERYTRWFVTAKAEPWTLSRLDKELGFNGDMANPEFDVAPHPVTEGRELECTLREGTGGKFYENWDLPREGKQESGEGRGKDARRLFEAKYRQQRTARKAKQAPDTSPARDDEIPDGVTEEKPE